MKFIVVALALIGLTAAAPLSERGTASANAGPICLPGATDCPFGKREAQDASANAGPVCLPGATDCPFDKREAEDASANAGPICLPEATDCPLGKREAEPVALPVDAAANAGI
ncbi:hypothetical protein B9Z65_6390 [Elsinoe australis]|uniref:Uncharacterized protein n=1 Tax=Elsinoe australis TaxID=40998 RepID=A0A2P8A8I0_9PEZI|nr:hypothetical protein B9Z65_6390 [Elsinoe australis]